MIKRLRLKFIAVMMGVLLVVFAVMFLTLNIFMWDSSVKQTDRQLQMIAAQDGILIAGRATDVNAEGFPTRPGAPAPERIITGGRFFYGKLNHENEVSALYLDMMYDMPSEEALTTIHNVMKQGAQAGAIDGLRFRIAEKDYGRIVVFAETRLETGMLQQLMDVSLWAAGGSFLLLLIVSLLLSKWVVAPVETAFAKQRQFVSDAGHELRTPLTILSANADVLENEIGDNAWLQQMRAQVKRMNLLIHDLLSLARTDENDGGLQMAEFDWSQAVLSTALEFESNIFEEGKQLTLDVREDIRHTGDQARMKQVVGILLDNAVKHSCEAAEIHVALKEENGKIALSIYNTGMGVKDDEREKIFERFYRSDASRSRETGGYGLGLAIANAAVKAHKGSIAVEGEYGNWVRFTVIIPVSSRHAAEGAIINGHESPRHNERDGNAL